MGKTRSTSDALLRVMTAQILQQDPKVQRKARKQEQTILLTDSHINAQQATQVIHLQNQLTEAMDSGYKSYSLHISGLAMALYSAKRSIAVTMLHQANIKPTEQTIRTIMDQVDREIDRFRTELAKDAKSKAKKRKKRKNK